MRRIIAMLLAIVMLVGNVPVQAFATEGQTEASACVTPDCTYAAGHEGNCSNYVAPEEPDQTPATCETSGCEYEAGHEGHCSNYVEPAADVTVYVTVSDRGELGMAYGEVTVSDINRDGRLSVDEALYAAHTVYGKGYASENGTVTKLWDVETTNVSFFVNHEPTSTDVSADTIRKGDYLVASVDQDAVNDYDKYSRFHVEEKRVSGGDEFILTLLDNESNALAGMEIGLSNGDGTTTMLGQSTDENGQVTLTLDQEGIYCVTAKGTLVEQSINLETNEFISIETPIIAPVCVVTVSGNAKPEVSDAEPKTVIRSISPTAKTAVATDAGGSNDVNIYFSVVDAETGDFIISRRPMTVSPGIGAAYGWYNDKNGDTMVDTNYDHSVGENECTPVDALILAHQMVFGENFTVDTVDQYLFGDADYTTGFFGRMSSGGIGFRVNGVEPSDADGCRYAANEYVLKDGEEVVWLAYSSSEYYNDYFAYFTDAEGTQVHTFTVEAGKSASLVLNGLACMWGVEEAENLCQVDILLAEEKEDGFGIELTETVLETTVENGAFSFTFDSAGEYYLSARGPYYNMNGTECKLIMPLCKITVAPVACQHTNTTTTHTPVAGQKQHTVTVTCDDCSETVNETTADCTDEDSNNTCDICGAVLPVEVTSITLNETTLTMTMGDDPIQLTATVEPGNATDKTVTWSSTDASVATAKDGLVTAVGVGNATITATVGSAEATCQVTVNPAEVSTGIILKPEHKKVFVTSQFLEQVILEGLDGTASGSGDNNAWQWTVNLAADTQMDQPITFIMTPQWSAQVSAQKDKFYFWVNDQCSEKSLGQESPGTVTIAPVWDNARATIVVGLGQEELTGTKYNITLVIEGQSQNIAPELKDSSKTEEKKEIYAGEPYELDVASLFTDANEDNLTYTVKINDQAPERADPDYRFTPDKAGDYILVFRANDGTEDSADCYTVELTVLENTPPEINEDAGTEATVSQYFPWSIDLSKVFEDKEHTELIYSVRVNAGETKETGASYSYTPEMTGSHALVFLAKDPAGAESKEFTVTLTVEAVPFIGSTCTGTVAGDTWLGGIAIQGAEVEKWKWNVESGHDESETHILNIELDHNTADNAAISLAYLKAYEGLLEGIISGPDSVQLANGKGSVTVTVSNWLNSGTAKTYTLNFTNKPNTAPAASKTADMVDVQVPGDFTIDLTKIFSDADGDTLRYTVKQGDSQTEETVENGVFTRNIAIAGQKLFVFTAYDAWNASDTHTVFVTGTVAEDTYDVQLRIPEGITPSFYITGDFDGENGDTLGTALEAVAGETKDGFTSYTVKVPESVSRISFRGTDAENNNWGGMSVAVTPNMDPVTVIQLNAVINSKAGGSNVTADQALFRLADQDGYYAVSGSTGTDNYGYVLYRFLTVAWGTEDLAKSYTAYAVPLGELAKTYVTATGEHTTFEKEEAQQTLSLKLILKSSLTITAPTGAAVQVFQQTRYYNSQEVPVVETSISSDGTTTDWIFAKGDSSRMSYRVSMAGRITKAGYVNRDKIEVSWKDNDPSPKCQEPYDISTTYGSRGDDSLMLNVNGRNHLVMQENSTFRLRSYRIWEIINSDTSNIIIQPDMHYTLTGGNILNVTPVTSGNGNGKNNWLDLTATGSGVAYLEVGYDALQILTGNMEDNDGGQVAGFTFNACDDDRTGLVVVQVGNAATDVSFGIRCGSTWNNTPVAWDAEFDTLYFTGDKGQLTLAPSVASGEIDSVAVSADKGANWTPLTGTDGVYVADIAPGNNILRVTKTDNTEAYQVVRGDKVTITIDGSSGNVSDGTVEAGETIRIQLHGLHNPIGKMSGNYNPGYMYGQHLKYTIDGISETKTGNPQYNFVSNAWMDIQIPKDAAAGTEYKLTNGHIHLNVIGIHDITNDTENHRGINDDGCGTRGSGGTYHDRSILPEIVLKVKSSEVAVQTIELDTTSLTLKEGETAKLTATVTPDNATNKTVTWRSSNTAKVQVDQEGNVKAIQATTTEPVTITATAGDQTAECTVTVIPGLTFDIDEEDIDGYVTVSFEDQAQRVSSDLSSIDQKFKQPLGTIIEATRVPFAAYDTIATVTLRLLKAKGITPIHDGRDDSGFYLRKICNFTVGETTYDSLGEFDAGSGSGWMVTWTSQTENKQDWFINQGAHAFYVNAGDEIKWKYTCQLGADIGDTRSKAAVETVEKLIDAIGDAASVTLESETAIKEAREAYKELLPLLQGSVTNYDKLVAAENRLANLKASEEDKAAANEVINLIEVIGELKQDRKEAIQAAVTAALAAYDNLTDTQARLVTNLDELEAAEDYLELLNRVPANIADIYTTTGNYLVGKTLGTGSTNGEWAALGLARSGRNVADSYYTDVVAAVDAAKKEIGNGRLHAFKSTENSRLILALTAIGKDVTDVDGYNLLSGLNDLTYIGQQGVNGLIYALIALDSHDYTPVGVTKDALVEAILAKQIGDSGWALDVDATVPEVDLTAMAIQALAPYYGRANVKAAVDEALTWLSNVQNQDGSFSTTDGSNAESIAQVIVALTALGIDPDEDSRFIKTGITTVQALAQFYVEGGGFEHIEGTGRDDMATEQGYYALAAYARFKAGQTTLYDMSDVTIETSAANQAAANNVIGLINAIGTVGNPISQETEEKIGDARKAYDALTDTQKALISAAVLKKLTDAETELARQKGTPEDQAAANAVKNQIDAIGTVTSTGQADEIEAARRAYNELTPLQKNLVGAAYLNKLEAAEDALDALEKAAADEAAASAVEQKISNIGSNITLGSESKINTARNAYDALTADQKPLVNNYQKLLNAEAALKALKATESVTFTLLGCYKHGTAETSVHTLAKGNLQTWISTRTIKIVPGDTVRDVFEEALKAAGLEWKNPTGNYVESIKYNGNWIGEFTNGSKSGWMYTLNGKHPNLGVNQQTLINGDKIVFHYTDDYTTEEGRNGIGTTSTTTGSTTSSTTSTIYSTYTGTASNTAAAEAVDRLIEDIGEEITLDSEAKILAARASYDKLTEAQKKLVKNYDTLVAAEAKLAELKGTSSENVYTETGDYIQGLGTPGVGAIGGEWMVIGLARSGRSVPTGYYDHVLNYIRENINEKEQLHSAKSSDNSRMIMALTAIGKDVTNVDDHNLLVGLNDMDYIQKQGINGPIWALMAFDSGNYPVPEGDVSRVKLIDVILEAQLDDGGWALSGERSDPDMTGMAIQALAPYMQSHAEVKKAVEVAVWTLSKIQNDNGSYSSVDGPNSESIAQVIVALAALGIDAETDARFVKNGISALDALLTYYIPGGGFRHVLDGNLDGMATEQAYYALVAYNRMKQNQNFLYDMTDVIDAGGDVIVEESTEPTEMPTEPVVEAEEEANSNAVVIWTGVMTACAAVIAVLLLNRKKLFGKFL